MLSLYSQERATRMMIINERKEAMKLGEEKGRKEGEMKNTVEMCQEFGRSVAEASAMLMRKFGLTESASAELVNRYWKD